jgi:translation initiation factor RLI1
MREIVITMGEEATKTFNRILEEELKKEVIRFRKEHICRYCKARVSNKEDDRLCYARPDKEYYSFDNRREIINRLKKIIIKNKGKRSVKWCKW